MTPALRELIRLIAEVFPGTRLWINRTWKKIRVKGEIK
jgi:predicted phage tail protein